jgi:hypothetical protein
MSLSPGPLRLAEGGFGICLHFLTQGGGSLSRDEQNTDILILLE